MGRDKAGLLVGDQRLWEHQIATLRGTGPDELLISAPRSEMFAESGLTIVNDESPGLGPLAGIAAVLRAARWERLLVLAIDLPQMSADFLSELLQESGRTGRGLVPHGDDCFEPLAAVYTRDCLALADEHLHGEDRSMQCFVRAAIGQNLISARPIKPEQRDFFRNVNRPQDVG